MRDDVYFLVEAWECRRDAFCGDAVGAGKDFVFRTAFDFGDEVRRVDERVVLRVEVVDDGAWSAKGLLDDWHWSAQ